MNFTLNQKNGTSEGFCLIKSIDKKTTAKGLPFLDLILSDNSGEISAKLWDYNEVLHGSFSAGDIVKVRGVVSQYNGADQLRIDRMRKSVDQDNINPADFVPSSEYDPLQMFDELCQIANGFDNPHIKKLVLKIYEDYRDKLLFWPAASKMHHAMRGGLLYHTLSVVRLAQRICEVYPYVDGSLLLGGAMIHDIAKVDEFELNQSGSVNNYSLEGNLVGHLVKGAIIVDRYASLLGTPPDITSLLEHMVLSHHGQPDFGAAVRPSLMEAEILSILDNMDAKLFELAEALQKVNHGEFTNKLFALDNRKFYRSGLNDIKPTAYLFED